MKKIILSIVAAIGVGALISCGGSNDTRTFTATALGVQKMQRYWLLSLANSGLGMPFFGGFGGGGSTGGTTGSGGTGGGLGYASMGGFVRHFGGPTGTGASKMHNAFEAGTTGGTNGSGGTGGEDFYFDDWLRLWVYTQWSDTTFTSLFYLDQAKTMPAGHVISTFASNWETFPQSYTSTYEYTAGTLSGTHGSFDCTQTSDFEGSMTYNNTYVDGSHDQGLSSWNALGSNWQSRWDGQDGTWCQDHGSWEADGSGTYNDSNSAGWSATWHYNADWSGTAHLEGPDPKLPADLTWTSTGHYKAIYADGTSEEWEWNDIWGEEGSYGTTGFGGNTTGVTGGTTAADTTMTGSSAGTTGSGTTGSATTNSGTTGASG